MTTVPQLAEALQTVFTTLADRVALATRFVQRPSRTKLSGSVWVQTLVWGWLANPDATLEQLTEYAARQDVDIAPQALDQRWSPAAAETLRRLLEAALAIAISGEPAAIPILQRFAGVIIQDSTTVALPPVLAAVWAGCGGRTSPTSATLKCGVQLDLLHGTLRHLDLVAGRVHDQALPLVTAPLPPRSLRLADLGFTSLATFAALAAADCWWLSRLRSDVTLTTPSGTRWTLLDFVQDRLATGGEACVTLGTEGVAARLLVMPVPQHVVDARHAKLRKATQDHGREPSAAQLALAQWTILVTNVPPELLTLEEALIMARVRWQIELLFRLWKEQGGIDRSRSQQPWRVLCEVYAKLLAMVVQHWLLITSQWQYPDRSVTKASATIRSHAPELASALRDTTQLRRVLASIERCLRHRARIHVRSKDPATYEMLMSRINGYT